MWVRKASASSRQAGEVEVAAGRTVRQGGPGGELVLGCRVHLPSGGLTRAWREEWPARLCDPGLRWVHLCSHLCTFVLLMAFRSGHTLQVSPSSLQAGRREMQGLSWLRGPRKGLPLRPASVPSSSGAGGCVCAHQALFLLYRVQINLSSMFFLANVKILLLR